MRRELANLLNVGIITSDTSNNKVYYEVDQKYDFFAPLQEIFGGGITKSRPKSTPRTAKSIELPLHDDVSDLKALGNVEIAVLTGQFTRDDSSGVDVLIVGNVNNNALNKYVTELEHQEGKDLRYTVFSLDDFTYRLQIKDRFTANVLRAKKQVLLDKPGLLS